MAYSRLKESKLTVDIALRSSWRLMSTSLLSVGSLHLVPISVSPSKNVYQLSPGRI